MANKDVTDPARMEKIVSLCKRRGFIFQAGELYGGLNGCWDYGPLGVELKRNLKDYWWRKTVQERDDVLGMDGAILTMEQVLVSSGHVGGFSDPMVDCKITQARLRADQVPRTSGKVSVYHGAYPTKLVFELASKFNMDVPPEAFVKAIPSTLPLPVHKVSAEGQVIAEIEKTLQYIFKLPDNEWYRIQGLAAEILANILFKKVEIKIMILPGKREESADKLAKAFYEARGVEKPILIRGGQLEVDDSQSFNPENGAELTEPRQFNLMLQTNFGATGDQIAYLRPETAQSIFCQYKNVLDSNRVKLPFGIAQVGKSFRNEINPRNYIFRSREFEQMEIEYFCHPSDGLRLTEEWLAERLKFYGEIGIPREKLHVLDIPDGERAFYSQKTYDIEYEFPFGIQELEGVAYRTDYDLGVHEKGAGKSLVYFDEETKEKFLPHVVEPSAGCDRTVLALICEAFDEEVLTDEKGKEDVRTVLRFVPRMAPIKVGIFPLLKKNEEQVRLCREIQKTLQPWMNVFYDDGGAVGRRYRRQDEVGTPFCITVDFETLGESGDGLKNTVTLRHRDSMEQERLPISGLLAWLLERVR
jgi:glycyl-tRNA synthetase